MSSMSEIQVCEVSTQRRRWTDWAGFFFSLAFVSKFLLAASSLGLLLLPVLLHDMVMGFAFLLRGAPKSRLVSLPARVATYGSLLIVPAFLEFARVWMPGYVAPASEWWLRCIGGPLWLSGSILSAWGIWTLRYAFSIEPQARKLVRSGPYRIARHPIYLAYVMTYVGVGLLHPSWVLTAILVAWFALLYARMRYEEKVLRATFPEYEDYCARVAMFAPRFWGRRASHRPQTAPALAPQHSGT